MKTSIKTEDNKGTALIKLEPESNIEKTILDNLYFYDPVIIKTEPTGTLSIVLEKKS